MSSLLKALLLPFLVLLFMACETEVDDPANGDSALDDPTENDVAVCLQGDPFVADGDVSIDPPETGDAHEVSGLRWEDHEDCERFVVDFATEDGDEVGSPGEVRAEVLRELGVVRISLRNVEWVDQDATDATFDGTLARKAYSVWSPDGRWVYVDLHLAGEAEAHVAALENPARVVVDLRPGGGEIPDPAPAERHVVVLEPRPGEASYPLTITGYARTFEANVVARLEQDGEAVADTFTTATAWADAWGHYEITFEDGPSGQIELHVGEHSAKDGTWEGVAVELEMDGR